MKRNIFVNLNDFFEFRQTNPCRPTDRFGGKTLQLSKLAGEANKNAAMVAGEHQRWLKHLGQLGHLWHRCDRTSNLGSSEP